MQLEGRDIESGWDCRNYDPDEPAELSAEVLSPKESHEDVWLELPSYTDQAEINGALLWLIAIDQTGVKTDEVASFFGEVLAVLSSKAYAVALDNSRGILFKAASGPAWDPDDGGFGD